MNHNSQVIDQINRKWRNHRPQGHLKIDLDIQKKVKTNLKILQWLIEREFNLQELNQIELRVN